MKNDRLLAALVFVAAVTVSPALAQTKPPAQRGPQTSAALPIPNSKVALIFSDEFQDPKIGIVRFAALMTTLNREFEGKQKELAQMEQKMQQLQDEITKAQAAVSVVDPKSIQAKVDQLTQVKTDYQRKGEDAQALYNKRRGEIFQPLQDDIAKALEVYAKAHGITVIIDASQVPLVYAAETIDVTKPFIVEFNSKNPATALATQPKPK